MDAGIVQIIVALIGACAPIFIEFIRQRQVSSSETEEEPVELGETRKPIFPSLITIKGNQKRSFLDLSIILLYGSFFSAILSHSLVVSGRIPTLSLGILIQIFLITLLSMGTLVLSWYWRKEELTVGILAITTLFVLLLSPGGPIIKTNLNEGESGLRYLIFPVFVLVLLVTTSAIYFFGNPLAKNTPRPSRYKVTLLLSGLFLISSLTLGQQFIYNVSQDDLTPKFKDGKNEIKKVKRVLSTLRDKSLSERGLFYRLGSEIALSEYYLNNYFQLLSSPTEFSEDDNQARGKILDSLKEYNESLTNPLPYLADRLLWVHPTVREGNRQLNLELPGTTAKERLETLTTRRITHAMSVQPNTFLKFYRIFNYNTDILEYIYRDRLPEKKDFSRKIIERELYNRLLKRQQELENLFPSLPSKIYTNFLHQQLALPNSEEAYLIYATYAKVAPSYESESLRKIKGIFDRLDAPSQRAFITYIAGTADDLKNYNILFNIVNKAKTESPDEKVSFLIPDLEASSTDILALATLIAPNTNASRVSQNTTANIREFAKVINSILKDNAEEKKQFSNLLTSDTPEISVTKLFNQKIYELITSIKRNLDDTQTTKLFYILRDPVTPTIQKIAATLSPYNNKNQEDWLRDLLTQFIKLTPENREAILHHVAIPTYRAEGRYSLDPLSLLIFQADSLSYWLAFLCATIMMLPIIALAILLGSFFGSKLVERDRIRQLIAAETFSGEEINHNHTLGIPVELQGRENFLERLRKLSGRGWSTIAVVGRRGVGKSRILYELYQPTASISQNYAVKVWISAPSQYQEEDFIESILEQLAFNAEKAVASHLGALPFSVRRLEAILATSGFAIFLIATSIIAAQLLIINDSLDRPEVMITWFPVLLVMAASIIFLIVYFARLQPLNLSPWLERDRSHSPHTVLLYRRIQEIFTYISSRRAKTGMMLGLIEQRKLIAATIGLTLGVSSSFVIAVFFNSVPTFLLFSITNSLLFFRIVIHKLTGQGLKSERGANLMSLVAEYRNFAQTVVYRLEKGALGKESTNVMICIDELDKIVELDELRTFLRRIKAIFEVPGVYYYLSLSEDVLATLYLGSAIGKNEVDSSLDHIVRIPSLPWEKSQEVTKIYLEKRQISQLDSKMIDVLVAISFGIPRDLLRCCDELIANQTSLITKPQQFVNQKRKEQVEIAADSHEWSRQQRETFQGEALESAKAVKQALEKLNGTVSNIRELRVLVLILLLCYVEYTHDLEDSKRQAFLKELYDLGYSITLSAILDLITQMEQLEAKFLHF